jgi:hypothetical protein
MLEPFESLGKKIQEKWSLQDCDEGVFAEIAASELERSRALNKVSAEEVVGWLMKSHPAVEQIVGDVGQPPVRLYTGDSFYIEALFWVDGTTAIHEHPFAGAFGVLHGSILQSAYSFTPERVASKTLIAGQVRFLTSEVLDRGSVQPIHAGDELIHSVFYLDRTCVTIHVHTLPRPASRPQYVYLKPYLAVGELDVPSLMVIQTRMLETLLRTNVTCFWKAARELAGHCDPFMLVKVLAIAFRLRKQDQENWNALVSSLPAGSRWLLDYLLPCLHEKERSARIASLAADIHDPDQRYFLALLSSVPARQQLWELIAERFPSQEPQSLILGWVADIFKEKRLGIKLNSEMVFVLEQLLEDSDDERARPASRKSRSCGEWDDDTIRNLRSQFRALDIFRPLFNATAPGDSRPTV